MDKMELYYDSPASCWQETLPIGNGSLGAMIWGSIATEQFGLNEETIWSGYERDYNQPNAYEALTQVRELLFKHKYEEAEQLIQDSMLGEFMESYLPLGNLKINLHPKDIMGITNYKRCLDLNHSITTICYDTTEAHYEREYFASYPHSAIFMKLTCSKPLLQLKAAYESELVHSITVENSSLLIEGICPEHVDPNYIHDSKNPIIQGSKGQHFKAALTLLHHDGKVTTNSHEKVLQVENATTVILSFSAVKPAIHEEESYEIIKQKHIEDYTSLFDTLTITLGPQKNIPTNERLARLRASEEDNGLYALYFQYGRYLMISSSREGSLPANLQGIWSWEMRAPWSSNWTININLPMNYWPVQSCNLAPCFLPYAEFLKKLNEKGKKTAAINYHCRGSVLHHNTDFWLNTSPVGIPFGMEKGQADSVCYSLWPMGGAWLTSELYRSFEYNQDETYLRDIVYPILKDTVSFLVDWVVKKDGEYVTCPSTSPENHFYTPNGNISGVGISSAMDLTIIREAMNHYITTCKLLHMEDSLQSEVEEVLAHLTPIKLGSFGQILEYSEEYKEVEPGHRHLSHLYGLFPSEVFANDEKLIEACRTSLLYRLEHGGGHTGWSCAWIINLFAVLLDGENAYKYLKNLLVKSTYDNLWDAHPPFQIDGNFGGIAGIANMLVQDRAGELKILPALPKQFHTGSVKGLCIKNKKSIDITWENGELVSYTIHER